MREEGQAKSWRARAEELRIIADQMRLASSRDALLRQAAEFDRMADHLERDPRQ